MSDSNNVNANNAPLFQGMDEKERVYAPEQVPGAVHAPGELDAGGTAGSSTAAAAERTGIHEPDTEPGRANIAGAEGNRRTTPIVGIRPDVSANAPVVGLPAVTEGKDLDNTGDRRER